MKLLVFGSTGSVGRYIIEQALGQGHIVTAFTRGENKIVPANSNLKVFRGDVMDPVSVEEAVKDQEVVLCSLGAGRKGSVRAEGTRNIIKAMEKAGVRRFICQSTLGVGDSADNLNFFWKYVMFGFLLRQVYIDHEAQEEFVRKSDLDWTIIRPAAFTDGDSTGRYKHGFPVTERKLKLKISRADVADFMLKQLTDDIYLHKMPGLSY